MLLNLFIKFSLFLPLSVDVAFASGYPDVPSPLRWCSSLSTCSSDSFTSPSVTQYPEDASYSALGGASSTAENTPLDLPALEDLDSVFRINRIQYLIRNLKDELEMDKRCYLGLMLDLLTFDETQFIPEVFSPQGKIETIFNLYKAGKSEPENYQLEIKINVPNFVINARKAFFLRVVHTLIENAFKYNYKKVHVKIELSEDASTLIFSTLNDLPPDRSSIPEENWEGLFEVGRTEHKKSISGFGYGLPSSRLNASALIDHIHIHDSRVALTSSNEEGTEFKFILKLSPSTEDLSLATSHEASTATDLTRYLPLEKSIAHEVNNLLCKFLSILDLTEPQTEAFKEISRLLLPILKPREKIDSETKATSYEKDAMTVRKWIEINDPFYIWVIDDELVNVRLISRNLVKRSFSEEFIRCDTNSDNALKEIKEYMGDISSTIPRRPILIISDEFMPGRINGSVLMRDVFEHKKEIGFTQDILFILMSGETKNPFEGKVLFEGYTLQKMPVYGSKPIIFGDLLNFSVF